MVGGALAAFWVGLRLDCSRRFPRTAVLVGRAASPAGAGDERVIAIVPARDEAGVLPLTLPSLLRQGGLERVLLADDGSVDGTAEVARRVAGETAGGAPLETIAVPERPEGWSGKVHALSVAARSLPRGSAEWLLLTDADIRHRPGALAALLAQARDSAADLVSVMARLRAQSSWERLLVPPFVYFFHQLYPFRRVADPRSPVAAAAGGCVLLRTDALERIGGFEAIGGELIDDVALARAVAASGGRLWLGLDAGVESVRAYDSLGSLWRMISRNAFVQLGRRWSLVVLVLLGLGLCFVLPPLGALVTGALAALRGSPALAVAALLFFAAWILQALHLLPWVVHQRVGRAWSATLPVAAALYGAMTLSSALADRRGTLSSWRGRTYQRRKGRDGGSCRARS